MSEHGDRAGAGPEGPGRRRPPSRRMRERADEMADLLAHAAPAVRANRRRRSAAIPAAVVALGALTIGGVGVAIGLDTETAGAVDRPDGPSSPADPGGQPIGPAESSAPAARNTSAVADVPVEPDDDEDDRSAADDGRPGLAHPPARPHRPAAGPLRPPGPTSSADDDGDDEPRSSRTTTSTTSRTTTTRPRPTSTRGGERGADEEPSGTTTRSGRGLTPGSADLPSGDLDDRSFVPDASPTVDDG